MARKGGKALARTVKRLQGLFATFKNNFKPYQGESGEATDFKKKRDGSWFASERDDSYSTSIGKWFTQNISMPASGFTQGFNNPSQPRSDRAFQYGQMVGAVLNHWSTSMQKGPQAPTPDIPQDWNAWRNPQSQGLSGNPLFQTNFPVGMRGQEFSGFGASGRMPQQQSYEAWKARLSGPEGGEKRQFSQIARSWGGFLLSMQKNLPADLRAHAEIAANGTTNDSVTEKMLMENFRVHANIDHSGATASRQAAQMMRGSLHHMFKYATLGAQMQEGGARGSLASGQMLMHGLLDVESVINNVETKKLAGKLVDWLLDTGIMGKALTQGLAKSPMILQQAIAGTGRVLAGAAGAVAVGVGTLLTATSVLAQNAWEEVAAEAGSQQERKRFMDPALAQRLKKANDKLAMRNVSTPVWLLNKLGFWELESYKSGVLHQTLGLQSIARTQSSALGIRGGDVIAQFAAKRGKSIVDLSETEKNEALDSATEKGMSDFGGTRRKWDAIANSIPALLWDEATLGFLRGMPNFHEAYRQNLIKAKHDLITGQGIYANSAQSRAVNQLNALNAYNAFVASKSGKFWSEVRLTNQQREREAVGMRTRRQVQNFD